MENEKNLSGLWWPPEIQPGEEQGHPQPRGCTLEHFFITQGYNTIEEQILQKKNLAKPDSSPQVIKITWGKNSNSSKNIYSQWPANKKSKSLSQLRRNSCEKVKILRKFAFQILQKRAGKEGSSALAVWKGFIFVWDLNSVLPQETFIMYLLKVIFSTN